MQPTVEAQKAVKLARQKWEGAPFHVKAMAGAYMEPVLAAMDALLRVQVQTTAEMIRHHWIEGPDKQ